MASKIIGEMSARLGLDPSEFLSKMQGVQGVNAFTSAAMAREWRKTGVQGAEGLRLIDEALGIHVARPVSRIIAETLPGLSKAISSVLGGVAGGAFGMAIFEFAEHIGRKMDEAKKKVEEYNEAVRHTETVAQEARISFEQDIDKQRARLALLSGDLQTAFKFKMAEIDTETVRALAKDFNEVAEAQSRMVEKGTSLEGFWQRESEGWGAIMHALTTTQTELNIEKINEQAQQLGKTFSDLALAGQFKDAASAVAYFNGALEVAQHKLETMQKHPAGFGFDVPGQTGPRPQQSSSEEVAAQKQLVEFLKERGKLLADLAKQDADAKKSVAQAEEAQKGIEAQRRVVEMMKEFSKEIADDAKRLEPAVSGPYEIAKRRVDELAAKAIADFDAIHKAAGKAFDVRGMNAELQRLGVTLQQVLDAGTLAQAQAALPTIKAEQAPLDLHAGGTAMPSLSAGGTIGAQFAAFQGDQNAQMAAAKKAYEDLITPQQRYSLGVQELDLLLEKGLIDLGAYSAGVAQLEAVLVKAGTAAHKLQEEMLKLLERSGDPGAGALAFVKSLQIAGAGDAKMVFDELTAVYSGVENNAAKSIVDIVENYRGNHAKLIKELKGMWLNYFSELTEMALKNAMTKSMAGLVGSMGKSHSAGIPGLAGGPPLQGGQISGAAAGATLTTAGTQLIAAAVALHAAAAAMMASGGAGAAGDAGGLTNTLPGALPEAAEGGDFSPGSSLIAGEAGAERIDLGSHGGAQITPLGWSNAKSGGDIHYYDQRGSIVTDDVVRRAEAARGAAETENRAVARAVGMSQDIARRGGAGPPAR